MNFSICSVENVYSSTDLDSVSILVTPLASFPTYTYLFLD